MPHKNMKALAGFPLLEWSIRASLGSKLISRTIVSTDSKEYADFAISINAEAPFLRPERLATDISTDLDFVLHALTELEIIGVNPDYIVHLRPTTPMRDPNVIDLAIGQMQSGKGYSSLRSVHEMSESAYKSFEIDNSNNLAATFTKERNLEKSNQARQLFPKTYQANGYVDVLSVEHIKQTGQIHGSSVLAFLTDQVIEIDTLFDFSLAESYCNLNSKFLEKLFGTN